MNDTKKYLRAVRQCLPGIGKENAFILEQIREQIEAVPKNLTYSEIVDFIGTPEKVAAAQIENMAPSELVKRIRVQNWIKKIIILVAAVILVMFTAVCVAELIAGNRTRNVTIYYGPAKTEWDSNTDATRSSGTEPAK